MELEIKYQTFERFSSICKNKGIDPCGLIEKMQLDYIANSLEFDDKIPYQIKNDSNSELVRIVGRENNFIVLDNGNKIHVFDFEKIYEGEPRSVFYTKVDPSVRGVLEGLEFFGHQIFCFKEPTHYESKKKIEIPGDAIDPVQFLYGENETIKRIAEEIHNLSIPKEDFNLGNSDRVTISSQKPEIGENIHLTNNFDSYLKMKKEIDDITSGKINENGLTESEEIIRKNHILLTGEDPFKEKIEEFKNRDSKIPDFENFLNDEQQQKEEKSLTDRLNEARKNKIFQEELSKGLLNIIKDKEPNLSLGDKVTLDDGKDFYVVYKIDLDGSVWIRSIESLSDTIYRSTYINDLSRLKLMDEVEFKVRDFVTLDGGKDLYFVHELTEKGIKIHPIKDILNTMIIEDVKRLKYEGSENHEHEINTCLDNIGFCNFDYGDSKNMSNAYSKNPLMIRDKNGLTYVDKDRLSLLSRYLNTTTYGFNKGDDVKKIKDFIEVVKIAQNLPWIR